MKIQGFRKPQVFGPQPAGFLYHRVVSTGLQRWHIVPTLSVGWRTIRTFLCHPTVVNAVNVCLVDASYRRPGHTGTVKHTSFQRCSPIPRSNRPLQVVRIHPFRNPTLASSGLPRAMRQIQRLRSFSASPPITIIFPTFWGVADA